MNNSRIAALAAGVCLLGSTAATAQTTEPGNFFFNLSAGAQTQSHSLTSTSTFPIYNQTASANIAQTVDGGPFFYLSVGARVWGDIGLALGFSSFKDANTLNGSASIPHPVFFNRPVTTTFTAGSNHSEQNIYIAAVWFYELSDRIDVAFSAGPSFTRVKQSVLSNIVVPAGSQDAFPVIEEQRGWATGGIVGLDATYLLTANGYSVAGYNVHPGIGIFLRYNGGSATLDSGADVDAGGFQAGAGLRFRF